MSEVGDPIWLSVAQAVESIATAVGIVAAGFWAYYRFGLGRERETALEIDLTHSSTAYEGGIYLVHFDVTLANKGRVRVVAKRARCPAYCEDRDRLDFSGDLLLRRVDAHLGHGDQVRWWSERKATSPQRGDIEADLLDEYECDGQTDFWLEPGETQHAGVAIVLEPGTYLAVVTFVGARDDSEFWRRTFVVNVPKPAATPAELRSSAREADQREREKDEAGIS